MKKILSALISLITVAVLVVPMVAAAQPATQCNLKHDLSAIDAACKLANNPIDESDTKAWGMCCMLDAVYTVTDWIFVVLIIIVALLIAWGGFLIATAAGAPEKVASGRNYILYALIGLAVALLAKALPSIVKALLGV